MERLDLKDSQEAVVILNNMIKLRKPILHLNHQLNLQLQVLLLNQLLLNSKILHHNQVLHRILGLLPSQVHHPKLDLLHKEQIQEAVIHLRQ